MRRTPEFDSFYFHNPLLNQPLPDEIGPPRPSRSWLRQREKERREFADLRAQMPVGLNQIEARREMERHRWPAGVRCPFCLPMPGGSDKVTARAGGQYRCRLCMRDFNVRTGTCLAGGRVDLRLALVAAHYYRWACQNSCRPPSCTVLAALADVPVLRAWRLLDRIRAALKADPHAMAALFDDGGGLPPPRLALSLKKSSVRTRQSTRSASS